MKIFKRVLLIVLVMTAFSANAQFKLGVGGGLNMSNFGGSDVSNTDSRLGFNGGFMVEIKLPVKLGFEADILFSTKGASVNFDPTFPAADYKLSYIDVPVVVKIYMAKVLSFQLGGQYSMLISGKFAGTDVKDQLKSSDLSAVVGFGLDVLKVHTSVRYNYGLTSIDDTGSDVKSNMITLTLGVWIK